MNRSHACFLGVHHLRPVTEALQVLGGAQVAAVRARVLVLLVPDVDPVDEHERERGQEGEEGTEHGGGHGHVSVRGLQGVAEEESCGVRSPDPSLQGQHPDPVVGLARDEGHRGAEHKPADGQHQTLEEHSHGDKREHEVIGVDLHQDGKHHGDHGDAGQIGPVLHAPAGRLLVEHVADHHAGGHVAEQDEDVTEWYLHVTRGAVDSVLK